MKTLCLFLSWLLVLDHRQAYGEDLEKRIIEVISRIESEREWDQKLMAFDKDATLKMADMLQAESNPLLESLLVIALVNKYDQLFSEFTEGERDAIVQVIVEKTRASTGKYLDGKLGALRELDHPFVTALATELKATVTEPRTIFAVDSLLERIAERAHSKTENPPPKGTHGAPDVSQKEQPPDVRTVPAIAPQKENDPPLGRWWLWALGAAILGGLAWLLLNRRSQVS